MSEPGLYDRPVLVLDPGVHTAPISRADVDAAGRFGVTGSNDRTVRVWDLVEERLVRTIRVPIGPGHIGKLYAVAISPDGGTIAAGGWTRWTESDPQEQIYLFDRATGVMTGRLDGLPNVILDLSFAPNVQADMRLAAVLGGRGHGLRVYDRGAGGTWTLAWADPDYGDDSYGVAFGPGDRIATTSYDGRLRLYAPDGGLLTSQKTDLPKPYGLAFNPSDGRLAVGFVDQPAVRLYDGMTLAALPGPDTTGIGTGDLVSVAWAADGATIYAGGQYNDGAGCPVLAWDGGGTGPRRVLRAGDNTVMSLCPLPGCALLAAAGDPWLGVIAGDGHLRWPVPPVQMDPRGQRFNFSLSQEGRIVDFGLDGSVQDFARDERGKVPARFDLDALSLTPDPPDDPAVTPPRQDGLEVTDWVNSYTPQLAGRPLPLTPYEFSRSLAIHPDGARFVLGTEWSLRAFGPSGTELWRWDVPGIVWAVNITGDGRLVVAAFGDGTIRWHRMEDGAELLALFPMVDRENWVAWTPEGIYAATPGARDILRWHVNHGWDAAADAVPVSQIPETHRPEVIPHVLPQMGTAGALAVAELAKIRGAVQRATGSDIAPGARLHVLTIGIGDYGKAARHLNLAYAARDAEDVAIALRNSQSSLFAEVRVRVLVDRNATKDMIFNELSAMASAMQQGGGNDLGVILFAGHGEVVGDGRFYLLPHGTSVASQGALKATGLAATAFRDEIAAIARHGRVLVLLDACRSGGATSPMDRSLRALLTAPNVTVFTSSTAGETSYEHPDWENGAFTEALLEAFREADYDNDTLIRLSDLSRYLAERVPALTAGRQHPDVEIVGQDVRILAAAL